MFENVTYPKLNIKVTSELLCTAIICANVTFWSWILPVDHWSSIFKLHMQLYPWWTMRGWWPMAITVSAASAYPAPEMGWHPLARACLLSRAPSLAHGAHLFADLWGGAHKIWVHQKSGCFGTVGGYPRNILQENCIPQITCWGMDVVPTNSRHGAENYGVSTNHTAACHKPTSVLWPLVSNIHANPQRR